MVASCSAWLGGMPGRKEVWCVPAVWEEALELQLSVLGSSEAPGLSSPPWEAQRTDCFFSWGSEMLRDGEALLRR